MDHLAGSRCIIPGVFCDREWDQEEIVKNIVEKYQRGRERHCVGSIVAGILLLGNRFDLDAIGQEGAVMAILFWVVGVIYMLIYAKKKF